jgi:hypothetical protein
MSWSKFRRCSAAALLTLVAGTAAAPAATAVDPEAGVGLRVGDLPILSGLVLDTGSGFRNGPHPPLFDVEDMAPGQVETRVVRAKNFSLLSGKLSLRVLKLKGSDFSCTEPEAAVDPTCGTGAGELEADLNLKVFRDKGDDGVFEATPVFDGRLSQLTGGKAIAEPLPAGKVYRYRFVAELPLGSTNVTQTDRVGFDLEFHLKGLELVAGTIVSVPGSALLGGLRIGEPSGQRPGLVLFGLRLIDSQRPPALNAGAIALVLLPVSVGTLRLRRRLLRGVVRR